METDGNEQQRGQYQVGPSEFIGLVNLGRHTGLFGSSLRGGVYLLGRALGGGRFDGDQ